MREYDTCNMILGWCENDAKKKQHHPRVANVLNVMMRIIDSESGRSTPNNVHDELMVLANEVLNVKSDR